MNRMAMIRFGVACYLTLTASAFARQSTGENTLAWQYHPNRAGAEAYMQGGAYSAATGNLTSMLFNPAGLAQMPGRFSFMLETGWASRTDLFRFFNIDITTGFQPVQFGGLAFQPQRGFSLGAFFTQPTNYEVDLREIRTTALTTTAAHAADEPQQLRNEIAIGVAGATAVTPQLYFGGSVEWRRARMRNDIAQAFVEGEDAGLRFSLGVIALVQQWQFGVSAQSRYEAASALPAVSSRFVREEPAAIRLGLTTPAILQRLHLSAETEYKNFDADVPIKKWQFYGGGKLALSPGMQLGFGAFTFLKDYSAFIDGPESEIFLTTGATIRLSSFHISASYLDGDLLNKNFAGQRFLNLALGYTIP